MASPGSYAKGVAKRQEILQVALEVFAQEGYSGTSLRSVAQRCGLSLPGLLHYFDSREHLFVEILRKRDERHEGLLAEPDPVEAFLGVLAQNMNEPGLVELFVVMSGAAGESDHPAHAFFAERHEMFLDNTARALRQLAAQRGIVLDEGDEGLQSTLLDIARTVLAVADGLQQQWLVQRELDLPGMMRAFIDHYPGSVLLAEPSSTDNGKIRS